MTLLDLSISLIRTNELLERQCIAQEKMAAAFERLSPILPDYPSPYKAGIKDLIDVSPGRVQDRTDALEDFADRNQVLPQSDAFRAKVMEYEDAVKKEYGQEAVDCLPWNVKK